jgi:hydroxymethylpyrimidine pyrophosphatase-like HAD family hydrolase
VPLEGVVAFGDGENDIEVLQLAGWGVAMKNARVMLKDVADEITSGGMMR